MEITLRGDQTAVTGTISNLNIFDFVTGSANFALTFQTVDVDLDGNGNAANGEQLNDASLLTLALERAQPDVGASGAGLAVTSGTLGVTVLSAPTPTVVGQTDTRSWLALSANSLGITLSIPGLTGDRPERHGPAQPRLRPQERPSRHTTPLNWTTATGENGLIDFNQAGGYTANLTDLVDPGDALSPQVAMPVTIRGGMTAVGGKLVGLDVFGILTGSADFAMVSQLVDVDFDGNPTDEHRPDRPPREREPDHLRADQRRPRRRRRRRRPADRPRRHARHRHAEGAGHHRRRPDRHPQLDRDHRPRPGDLADPARHAGRRSAASR